MKNIHRKGENSGYVMCADTAILGGVRGLWEQFRFLDCTIHVQNHMFHVHKVIISSVSGYCNTFFSRNTAESDRSIIHLDGVSVLAMDNLINFIYRGKLDLSEENVPEILAGAKCLQIESAIEVCAAYMIDKLNVQNCYKVISIFQEYSLTDKVKEVRSFIEGNLHSSAAESDAKLISYDELCFLLDNWTHSEMDLFYLIEKWVEAEPENRKALLNDLMTRVRFCLMTLTEIGHIREMKLYRECFGSWRCLVDEAVEYHDLAVHLKVLCNSEQSTLRNKPTSACFTGHSDDSAPCIYALSEEKEWRVCELRTPQDCRVVTTTMVVNDFLIVSPMSSSYHLQQYFIFDPRTMAWSELQSTRASKAAFVLVHHQTHLYAIGGFLCKEPYEAPAYDGIEKYDFQTDTWSSFMKLPDPLMFHGACILGNSIYISGGQQHQRGDELSKVDCLHLYDEVWERKAPMLEAHSQHSMSTMKLQGKEVICIIDDDFQLEYYDDATNQWHKCTFVFSHRLPSLRCSDRLAVDGNTVLLADDHHRGSWCNRGECLRLTYPEEGDKVMVEHLDHFSPHPSCNDLGLSAYGAVLPVPVYKLDMSNGKTTSSEDDYFDEDYYRESNDFCY